MAVTRRNTLIGLGALAGGAGIIGGTGAFDTVEADRQFDVDVGGDQGALLALSDNESPIVDEVGDLLEITLEDHHLNDNATTIFEAAFNIHNQGTNEVDLDLEFTDSDGNSVGVGITGEDDDAVTFDIGGSDFTDTTLNSGEDQDVSVHFNTRGDGDDLIDSIEGVTIIANSTE